MQYVRLPFPAEQIDTNRWQARVEPIWEATDAWAAEQGLKKEHGHWQGAPAPQ
jgi:hypothetical protein